MRKIRLAVALVLVFALGFTAVTYSMADSGTGGNGVSNGKAPKGRVTPSAPSVYIIRKSTDAWLENSTLPVGSTYDNISLRISGATVNTASWSSSDPLGR